MTSHSPFAGYVQFEESLDHTSFPSHPHTSHATLPISAPASSGMLGEHGAHPAVLDDTADYLISPHASKSPLPLMSSHEDQAQDGRTDEGALQPAPQSNFSLSPLSMQEGMQHITPPTDAPALPEHGSVPFMHHLAFPQQQQQPQLVGSTFYPFQYQQMGFGPHTHSPPTPLSLSVSGSPPGSASSRTHGIPPYIVTPGSNVSPLSDTTGIYNSPPGYQMAPPTTMGFMPPGAPYPFPQHRPVGARTPLRVLAKNRRGASGASVKVEDEEELEDLEDEPESGALGLRSIEDDFQPHEPLGDARDMRRARIESEQQKKQRLTAMWQRRRTEMRAGFDRLRDVLPTSNQRPSKTVILDRAVGHIQQIESANRFLALQHDKDQAELLELRRTNQSLIATVTASRGQGSSSR